MALVALAGCARSSDTIDLMAAFSDDTIVGELTASWHDGGEERQSGDVKERRLAYRVDAHNRLSDPVYLRLRRFRLLGGDGPVPIGDTVECALQPGTTAGLLDGSVWVPVPQATAIRRMRVEQFAVPLSERGRAFYRQFLLQQRPDDAVAIDAEIAAYMAAPRCKNDSSVVPPPFAEVLPGRGPTPDYARTSASLFFAALPTFVRPYLLATCSSRSRATERLSPRSSARLKPTK